MAEIDLPACHAAGNETSSQSGPARPGWLPTESCRGVDLVLQCRYVSTKARRFSGRLRPLVNHLPLQITLCEHLRAAS
jgi:hypothetical protein